MNEPDERELAPAMQDAEVQSVAPDGQIISDDDPLAASKKMIEQMKGLGRNSKCPCGSGKKVKHCCEHLLAARAQLVDQVMAFDNAVANNNRAARAGKDGYEVMSKQQYWAHLKKIRDEARNKADQEKSE